MDSQTHQNPIQNLWNELVKHIRARKPTNLQQQGDYPNEEWQNFPADLILVINYTKMIRKCYS